MRNKARLRKRYVKHEAYSSFLIPHSSFMQRCLTPAAEQLWGLGGACLQGFVRFAVTIHFSFVTAHVIFTLEAED